LGGGKNIDNGVLTVTFMKTPEAKPKKISVTLKEKKYACAHSLPRFSPPSHGEGAVLL